METEHKACVKCNRKFKNITAMNNHVARFHTEAFTCKECDRSFKIKAALEVHILKTHGQKCGNATVIFENGEFDWCRKINEKYNNAPSKLHKDIHENIKRFGCDKCEKKFRHRLNYKLI